MARGQRKPLEQKIEEKQKIIDSLEIRIEKEREELLLMWRRKKKRQGKRTARLALSFLL